jgi:membrane associated rhomboid family serine protease
MKTPILTWILIALNIIIFIWQKQESISGQGPSRFENWALIPERDGKILDGQNITSFFTHANVEHLFYNMMALYLFGAPLENAIGPWHLGGIFLLGGVVSNLLYSLFYRKSQVALVGASGAISAIAAAYYLHFSRYRSMTSWILFQLLGLLIFSRSGISFASHLFGFAVGAATYYLGKGALRAPFKPL